MDTIVLRIDVSKDKRDIAVRPNGEVFGTSPDAQGLDALIARLTSLAPNFSEPATRDRGD